MSETTSITLAAVSGMIERVRRERDNTGLAYSLGGRKAAIVSGHWRYLKNNDPRLIDISPEEWLDEDTLFKRLELSHIQRMIAGEE